MKKTHMMLLVTLLMAQPIFANDSKNCAKIADACMSAGFADKSLWNDCMKPIVLGKQVEGVTLDVGVASACRTDKINELKQQLKELESVG